MSRRAAGPRSFGFRITKAFSAGRTSMHLLDPRTFSSLSNGGRMRTVTQKLVLNVLALAAELAARLPPRRPSFWVETDAKDMALLGRVRPSFMASLPTELDRFRTGESGLGVAGKPAAASSTPTVLRRSSLEPGRLVDIATSVDAIRLPQAFSFTRLPTTSIVCHRQNDLGLVNASTKHAD